MWPLLWASTREQRGTHRAGPLSPAQRWRSREPHKSQIRLLSLLVLISISSVIKFWLRLQMPEVIHRKSHQAIWCMFSPLFTTPVPVLTLHAKDILKVFYSHRKTKTNKYPRNLLGTFIFLIYSNLSFCQFTLFVLLRCLQNADLYLQNYIMPLASRWKQYSGLLAWCTNDYKIEQ